MSVDHVKSASITTLDTSPPSGVTAGRGGAGYAQTIGDYATAVASSSADATYQLVRFTLQFEGMRIIFESVAQGAGKFDLGLYYATDGTGGHATALLAAAAIDQDFFAAVIDCASAVTPTDVTNQSGTYTLDKRKQPIWQAVGLTSDPGGWFDIVATVKTTAVTTGTGKFGIDVTFVD